jgi:inhibitor of cysteine peptidase
MEIDGPGGPSAIELSVGEELVLHLPENPTTGYRWSLDPGPLGDLFTLLRSFYELGGPGMGAGGTRTFRFLATGEGTARIRLVLARSWETGAPLDEYNLAASVGDRD